MGILATGVDVSGFSSFVVRRRALVVLGWLVAVALTTPLAARLEHELDVRAVVRGGESARVESVLAERFGSPFARFAVLVVTGLPAATTDEGASALRSILSEIKRTAGVSGVLSHADARDAMLVGEGGNGSIVITGLDPADGRLDDMLPLLRGTTEALLPALRARWPAAALRWTGETPINFDLRQTSAAEVSRAEKRVLPVTLLLLLVGFGSLLAAALPLIAGIAGITITLGLAVIVNRAFPLSLLLQNTVTMIGLGLGIDYALLTLSRFRENLDEGATPADAARAAADHAGTTIALSGTVVAIGFAALLLVPLNELASVGVGGLIVVGTSVAIATTLLPAVLSGLGTRVQRRARAHTTRAAGGSDGWTRWGLLVVRHPWLTLLLAATPLVLLSLPALRLNPALPRGDWLPRRMESSQALRDLASMQRGGVVNVLHVIVQLPDGVRALEPAGWEALRTVTQELARDPRVARAQSLPTMVPFLRPAPSLLALVPASARQASIAADGRAGVVEVVPNDSLDMNSLSALVRDVRRWDAAAITSVPGVTLIVGGLPAANADYVDVIADRVVLVGSVVMLFTFLSLAIAFRSVLVPLKAILLNLLSVSSAFGAVVLVFQEGHGASLLGLSGPLGGVFPGVPILVFCVVFGLSMDYEVFLVSRIAEARERMDEQSAIVYGLATTGRVITSAATIMIAVFAAFMLGDFVMTKILGFALAIAVLVDATVVRLAIGPALLQLAGRWNWWPGRSGHPDGPTTRGQSARGEDGTLA